MRASLTIQYNPRQPEEVNEVKLLLNASDWKMLVWDLELYLYERLNHGIDYGSGVEELDKVRNKLHELLHQYNLSLDG